MNINFDSLAFEGKCDVCGKEGKVVSVCSTFGAFSFSYCEHCLVLGLEPYKHMVHYISCAGKYPEDISESYIEEIRRILKLLNISEEQFIRDTEEESKFMEQIAVNYEFQDEIDDFEEGDTF